MLFLLATALAAPVAHWALEDATTAVVDSIGGVDGTTNGVWSTTEVAPFPETTRALRFDGVDDTVSFTSSGHLGGYSTFSVAVWVRADSWGISNSLVTKYNTANGVELTFFFSVQSGKVRFGTVATGELVRSFRSVDVLPATTWLHLVATFDHGAIRLWRDGVELAAVSDGNALLTTLPLAINDQLRIGSLESVSGSFTGPSDWFAGYIDDVWLYDHALSPLEVEALYRWGDGPTDWDDDGLTEDVDNCPDDANPDQADWNLDGVGDACQAPFLDVTGSCPGPLDALLWGLTPNGSFAIVRSAGPGVMAPPSTHACAASASGLGPTQLRVLLRGTADGNGEYTFTPTAQSRACTRWVQLLDEATCAWSAPFHY